MNVASHLSPALQCAGKVIAFMASPQRSVLRESARSVPRTSYQANNCFAKVRRYRRLFE
jgi:hypothetical protein